MDADYGFYTEIDKEFAIDQIRSVKAYKHTQICVVDEETGDLMPYGEQPDDVFVQSIPLSDITFAEENTPDKLFDVDKAQKEKQFEYDVPVISAHAIRDNNPGGKRMIGSNKQLLDKNGKPLTIKAYIGLKGDANLDGRLTTVDATLTFKFVGALNKQGTDPLAIQLSNSVLAKKVDSEDEAKFIDDPSGIYDNFAAFLADAKVENSFAAPWRVGKNDRVETTKYRRYQTTDASYILRAAMLIGTEEYQNNHEAMWNTISGVKPEEPQTEE